MKKYKNRHYDTKANRQKHKNNKEQINKTIVRKLSLPN